MPNTGFSRREALALALLVLSWREQSFPPDYIPSAPAPAPAALPTVREIRQPPLSPGAPEQVKRGWELFQQRACHTCHSVGEGARVGPDLLGVMARRSDDWLRSWLSDPAAMIRARPELQDWPKQYGGVIMPNQNLSAEEIALLLAYLKTF
jgi:cytochrome c2